MIGSKPVPLAISADTARLINLKHGAQHLCQLRRRGAISKISQAGMDIRGSQVKAIRQTGRGEGGGHRLQRTCTSDDVTHRHNENNPADHIHQVDQYMGDDGNIQVAAPDGIDKRQHAQRAGDEHPGCPDMVKPKQKTVKQGRPLAGKAHARQQVTAEIQLFDPGGQDCAKDRQHGIGQDQCALRIPVLQSAFHCRHPSEQRTLQKSVDWFHKGEDDAHYHEHDRNPDKILPGGDRVAIHHHPAQGETSILLFGLKQQVAKFKRDQDQDQAAQQRHDGGIPQRAQDRGQGEIACPDQNTRREMEED